MKQYVDCASTMKVLLQDSGILPKPRPDWNTFVPHEGDLAHVDEDNSDYRFDGSKWERVVEEAKED